MKIAINEFSGIMPKLANDKLPAGIGQVASDLKTASKELVALRRSSPDFALPGTSYKTFFEYIENSNTHWVYYDNIVHWTRAPVADDQYERMYFTGVSGEYRAFANDINSAPWDFTTDYYKPNAPAGVKTGFSVNYSSGSTVYRAYFYTLVSRYGEESFGSNIVEISDYTAGTRVTPTNIHYPTGEPHLYEGTVKIYRTPTSGGAAATFQEVCEADYFLDTTYYNVGDFTIYNGTLYECSVAGSGTWTGGTHTWLSGELVSDANLGDTCDTYLYERAPANLTNLRAHPNGFSVASKNNVLHFTEPFKPWAWIEDYEIPIDAQIIGVGIFGSTIVCATDANIYTFSGPHPDSLYKQKHSFQPCLSQRAVVETDSGVLFPSAEGFQLVSGSGIKNITSDHFSPEDWEDFELSTMHGTWFNKAYYGFYKSADHEGQLRIDFLNFSITTGAGYHQAGHVALLDGKFRTIYNSSLSAPATYYISEWDADTSAYINYSYKTPRYILEKPANFKVAQVILDTDFYNEVLDIIGDGSVLTGLNNTQWNLPPATSYGYDDLMGPLNGRSFNAQDVNGDTLYSLSSLGVQDYVDFHVYVDGVLKFTKQVKNSNMFKLPRGFKNKKWEIVVEGMIPIKRIVMATSTEEIV